MKIGVILRKNKEYTLNKEINDVILSYGATPIGITSYDMEVLSSLDGFILQGGNEITFLDLQICTYLYLHHIPTLGICLGMQTMGVMMGGSLKKVKKHKLKKNKTHAIKIDTNTKLYDIIKNDKIEVTSRHKEVVEHTNLSVSSYSLDGETESIEDSSQTFFIGVQWHPESIDSIYSKRLFDAFFHIVETCQLDI